jgi:glycosyltransferase involved in cell wall biosynthesis
MGLPVVEAMSQGAPIIASKIPTNRELNQRHNDQMFLFDLDKSEQFIQYMCLLDRDGDEIRKRLNYGDLSQYSYKHIAQIHCKLYSSLLNTH